MLSNDNTRSSGTAPQRLLFEAVKNAREVVIAIPDTILEGQCVCSFSELRKKRTSATHSEDICSMHAEEHVALDIYTHDLLASMHLYYPKFTWTHTGWIQDYDIQYGASEWDSDPLRVYIVPFSHADPAWRSNFNTCFNKAKKILDLAVDKLLSDTSLTFVWAEVIFLRRWYLGATPQLQEKFERLLATRRFEVVTGGLVMTDESVATYPFMLDQLIEGHQWLDNEFNYHPNTSWAIDPFGLSSAMPYMLKESGIEKLFILRTHYSIKRHLAYNQQLEFHWRQTWDIGGGASLFTSMSPFLLYNIEYSCGPDVHVCCQFDFSKPKCWRGLSHVDPDPIDTANINQKAWDLLDQWRKKSKLFKHNIVLHIHGDDFRFRTNHEWSEQIGNLKVLMQYINNNPSMHAQVKFATLGDYFEAVTKYSDTHALSFPSLGGDFFTYTDRGQQYWSGMFTTRPFLKYMVRHMQYRLRAAEIAYTLALTKALKLYSSKSVSTDIIRHLYKSYGQLHTARETNGLLVHHDAITGTSKKSVVRDYLTRMEVAVSGLNKVLELCEAIQLLPAPQLASEEHVHFIEMLQTQEHGSALPVNKLVVIEQNQPSIVVLMNPLSHKRHEVVSLDVSDPYIEVIDVQSAAPVRCQVNPELLPHDYHRHRFTLQNSTYQLYFEVHLEALSLTMYEIRKTTDAGKQCSKPDIRIQSKTHFHDMYSGPFSVTWERFEDVTIDTGHVTVAFCHCTGLVQSIKYKDTGNAHKAEVEFVEYSTGSWANPFEDKSGAYIFMPSGDAEPMKTGFKTLHVMQGPLVASVATTTDMVTQKVSIYNVTGVARYGVAMENWVNLKSSFNTELAMRIKTDIEQTQQPVFYTDNNAFHMSRRTSLKRLPIQGNFYPMSSELFVEDMKNRMTLLAGQSHGVANLVPGQIDVMLDRILNQDDWRGMSEDVVDNVLTHSRFVLLFEPSVRPPDPVRAHYTAYSTLRSQALFRALDNPVIVSQQRGDYFLDDPIGVMPMKAGLPCDLHLVNLRTTARGVHGFHIKIEQMVQYLSDSKTLLILRRQKPECIYGHTGAKDICDASPQSQNVFDIAQYFLRKHDVLKVTGLSLTGVQRVPFHSTGTKITLQEMKIKTLQIQLR